MRNCFIAVLAGATLFATGANAETYVCQIRPNGQTVGLISDTITINIDDATLNAVVSDSIIRAAGKKYSLATLTTYTDKRLTAKWTMHGVKDSKNEIHAKIDYRLVIWMSQRNKASLTARQNLVVGGTTLLSREVGGSGKCMPR